MYSVQKCNKLSTFDKDGFYSKSLFTHKLFPLLTLENIKLDCMATYPTYKRKIAETIFPTTQRCPDSIVALGTILKKAKDAHLHIIELPYKDTDYYIFHRKGDADRAALYAYLIVKFTEAKTNSEKALLSYCALLLRDEDKAGIRGYYIHQYLYGRGLIPLPINIKREIKKQTEHEITTCKGHKIPYSSKKEYKMRYEVTKKMTNNFEQFEKALLTLKQKAEKHIEKIQKSKEFKQFAETHRSTLFKSSLESLLKKVDQQYLFTSAVKKRIRSIK